MTEWNSLGKVADRKTGHTIALDYAENPTPEGANYHAFTIRVTDEQRLSSNQPAQTRYMVLFKTSHFATAEACLGYIRTSVREAIKGHLALEENGSFPFMLLGNMEVDGWVAIGGGA